MKNVLLSMALGVAAGGLVACVNTNEPAAQQPQPSAPLETNSELAQALVGDWQEDLAARVDDKQVFVPGALDLGPSRFRPRFSLMANGAATILVLSPTDGHYEAPGTWALAGSTLTMTYAAEQNGGEVSDVFEVISASASSLILERQ